MTAVRSGCNLSAHLFLNIVVEMSLCLMCLDATCLWILILILEVRDGGFDVWSYLFEVVTYELHLCNQVYNFCINAERQG